VSADESPARQDHVQSLTRGLAVLRTFDANHPDRSLSEVAREAGLARAAARRSLLTLQHLGYVGEHGGRFWLRARVLELGFTHLSSMSLKEVAEEHLEALAVEAGTSSSMCTLDGEDIVYVARVPSGQVMTVSINLGTRFPAHATSMGRVLLAGLPDDELAAFLAEATLEQRTARTVTDPLALKAKVLEARQQGWAFVDQELEEGLRAVAAPVRTGAGQTVAAVNLSCHASQGDLAAIRRTLLPPLLAAVARIETDLAVHPDLLTGMRPAR
jgi:IclR family pca regulon transcriptional regulator